MGQRGVRREGTSHPTRQKTTYSGTNDNVNGRNCSEADPRISQWVQVDPWAVLSRLLMKMVHTSERKDRCTFPHLSLPSREHSSHSIHAHCHEECPLKKITMVRIFFTFNMLFLL